MTLLGLTMIAGVGFLIVAPFLLFGVLGGIVFYLVVDAVLRR